MAYRQKKDRSKKGKGDIDTAELRAEQARLSRERREMARMRKDMQELSENSPETKSVQSIEERMATLDELLTKDLITKEEYENKRQEILNEI